MLDGLNTKSGSKEAEADQMNYGQDAKPLRVGDLGAAFTTTRIRYDNLHFKNNQHGLEFSPQMANVFLNIDKTAIVLSIRVDFGANPAYKLTPPWEEAPASRAAGSFGRPHEIDEDDNRLSTRLGFITPDIVGLLRNTLRVRKGFPMNMFSKITIQSQENKQVEIDLKTCKEIYEHYALPMEMGERPGRMTMEDASAEGPYHAMGATSFSSEKRRRDGLEHYLVNEIPETHYGEGWHLLQNPAAGQPTVGHGTHRERLPGIYGYIDFEVTLPLKLLHRSMENLGVSYMPPPLRCSYEFEVAGVENFLMLASPAYIPSVPHHGLQLQGDEEAWRGIADWVAAGAGASAAADIVTLRAAMTPLFPMARPYYTIGVGDAPGYTVSEMELDSNDPRRFVGSWVGNPRRVANNDSRYPATDQGNAGAIPTVSGRWELTSYFPQGAQNRYNNATANSGRSMMSATCINPSNPTAQDRLLGIFATWIKQIMEHGTTNGLDPDEGNVEVFFMSTHQPEDANLRTRHNYVIDETFDREPGVRYVVCTKAFDNKSSEIGVVAVRGGVTSEALTSQSFSVGFPIKRCEVLTGRGDERINREIDFFNETVIFQRGALLSNTMGFSGEQIQPEKVEIGVEATEQVLFHGGMIIGATNPGVGVANQNFGSNPWGESTNTLVLPLPNFSLVKNSTEKSDPAQFNRPRGYETLTNVGKVNYWRLAAKNMFTGKGGFVSNTSNSTIRHALRSLNFNYACTQVTDDSPKTRIMREVISWSVERDAAQRELFVRQQFFDSTRSGEYGLVPNMLRMDKQRLEPTTSARKVFYNGRMLITLNNNGGISTIADTPQLPGDHSLMVVPTTGANSTHAKYRYRVYILATSTDHINFAGEAVVVSKQMAQSVLNPESTFTPRMLSGLSSY